MSNAAYCKGNAKNTVNNELIYETDFKATLSMRKTSGSPDALAILHLVGLGFL